jgi:hypothetical protein
VHRSNHVRPAPLALGLSGTPTALAQGQAGEPIGVPIQPEREPEIDRGLRRVRGAPGPPGSRVLVTLEADAAHQFRAGIDSTDGGEVSSSLVGSRLSVRVPVNRRTGLSLSAGAGLLHYEFSGPSGIIPGDEAPWENIVVGSVGAGISHAFDERWRLFAGANLSSAGERATYFDETLTVGGTLGVAYAVSDKLTVGGGLTVQTRLDDSVFVLPFPTVEWVLPGDPQERWRLVVGGSRIGPSRAAGAAITFDATEQVTLVAGWAGFGLGGDFRLDDTGPAPGGVGRDRAFPIVVGVDWRPTRQVRLSAFAGAALFGELEILDSNGNRLAKRRVDPSPTIGVGLSVSF